MTGLAAILALLFGFGTCAPTGTSVPVQEIPPPSSGSPSSAP